MKLGFRIVQEVGFFHLLRASGTESTHLERFCNAQVPAGHPSQITQIRDGRMLFIILKESYYWDVLLVLDVTR